MYPEDVYNCGLPLPLELLRPVAFQVAYEHIKEKLRFPKAYMTMEHDRFILKIIDTQEYNFYLHWRIDLWDTATGPEMILTFKVSHLEYAVGEFGADGFEQGNERQYITTYSKRLNKIKHRVLFGVSCDFLASMISHT